MLRELRGLLGGGEGSFGSWKKSLSDGEVAEDTTRAGQCKLPHGRTGEQGGARATEGWSRDAGGGAGRGEVATALDVGKPGSLNSVPGATGAAEGGQWSYSSSRTVYV